MEQYKNYNDLENTDSTDGNKEFRKKVVHREVNLD